MQAPVARPEVQKPLDGLEAGAAATPLPAWVDLQLHVVLSMPVAAGDLARAKQRVDMVLATARAL